jgi:glycerophosphoryl diester phosphodiesterase
VNIKAEERMSQTTLPFLVIAHRGASSYAPENTVAAYDLALEMEVRHIELDVELTSDNQVVVIHDDTVDRTTDGTGPVTSYSLEALKSLDAGAWFDPQFSGQRIPTFEEVLGLYKGRLHFHTEIKGRSPTLARHTADVIRKQGVEEQVTITSFQYERLREMRTYAPELPAGWLVREVNDTIIAQAHEIGLSQLCPQANTVTPELVYRLHAEGLFPRAWGVTNKELMAQVVHAGADGMTVNFPDKLITYLEEHNRAWE